jgi:hypothetical protein
MYPNAWKDEIIISEPGMDYVASLLLKRGEEEWN